ncbi:bacterio-opsin activator domain-containing protein [Halobaculum sp. EA56]|uniref:helix-turn-helix domain-containing protein n=1 Tax=Halobaculum sp. EA56 TaxID=3421648 RepID=UPI003EB82A99
MDGAGEPDTVVELEFDIGDAGFFLVEASEAEECELLLEEVMQRSDGTVVEYLSVSGADPERLLRLAGEADGIEDARLVYADDESALFEFVSTTAIATTLADDRTHLTDIEATAGDGRMLVEVPPHVDATAVVDSFLTSYPDASLLAKRTLDRSAPLITPVQGREAALRELTDRQLQALRTAHAMGYFERPREATAAEVADELGVTDSTFGQHLRVAERKVFDELFEPERR